MTKQPANTPQITDLERAALGAYFKTEYGDGPGTETWSFSITDNSGIPPRQMGGVMSSLVKKGLIRVSGAGKYAPDSATALTEAGIAACVALGIK